MFFRDGAGNKWRKVEEKKKLHLYCRNSEGQSFLPDTPLLIKNTITHTFRDSQRAIRHHK
jgi:hypothetical protein